MCTKLNAIKIPESANVHTLCRDSRTSQGMADNMEAMEAPKPNSTSNDGRAQQNSVPRDVNREK